MSSKHPIRLYYVFSRQDEALRDQLENHLSILRRSDYIAEWHDRRITPGTEWKTQIDRHLEQADVILLLVSPDFLASDYCYEVEMARALERHDSGDAVVVPIILRPVDWKSAPFAKLQALPRDGRPITSFRNIDEAFTSTFHDLRRIIRHRAENYCLFLGAAV